MLDVRQNKMSAAFEQLARLEEILGASLPQDYREFVLSDSGSSIEDLDYEMPHPDGSWIETVVEFYSLDDLIQKMEMEIDLRRQGIGDHPQGTLSIASNGCGDEILLSYRDSDSGAIYHAFCEEGDMDDPWLGVYRLASTFTEWRSQLARLRDEEDSE